jgi:hypothetical protein
MQDSLPEPPAEAGTSSVVRDRARRDPRIVCCAEAGCQDARWRSYRAVVMTAAVIVALPYLAACASRGPAAAATVPTADEQAGTIRRVDGLGFAIVPDRDPTARYVPDRAFPPEFQVDGLRVRFSGTETQPAEGVRSWGTPFRLATLRRAGS